MIEEFASLIPPSLLDVSGSVFYSGRNAFRGTRPLYILGVNPGGSPDTQAHETVAWHTKKVLEREPDDWSAYRDESWKGAAPGRGGMQPRVLHLLRRVGLPPGGVPASNIVFARSRRENQFLGSLLSMAEVCWPFHHAVIQRLEPRVVLCFGGTAGEYVRRQLGANKLIREFVEKNNRQWRSRLFRNSAGTAVVVATHPVSPTGLRQIRIRQNWWKRRLRVTPNKWLQRTVIPKRVRGARAPFHYARAPRFMRQRAAAEPQR